MCGTMHMASVLMLCAFGLSVEAGRDMSGLSRSIRSLRDILYSPDPRIYETLARKRQNIEKYCNNFVLESKYLSTGDELKKVGYVTSDQTCLDACAMETEFYCAAAMLRMGNMCFLSGFKPRANYYSTQYYKTCEEGEDCFAAQRGVSLGYSSTQRFPGAVMASSPKARVNYCQTLCQETRTCVGFAIREKKDRCYLTTLDILPNNNFDLYLRQCSPE